MIALRELRKKNNLTQVKLAEIVGISAQRYNMYERGKRKLPIEIATQISKKFNVTLEDIFLKTS